MANLRPFIENGVMLCMDLRFCYLSFWAEICGAEKSRSIT